MGRLKAYLIEILKDKLFIATVILFVFKAIVFIGIMNSPNAAGLNLELGIEKIPFLSVYLAFTVALLSFNFLFKGWHRLVFLVVINLIYSFILMSDLWYYRGFGSFISMQLFKMTANLNNMGDSIASMGRPIDLILFVDVIIIVIFAILLRKEYKQKTRSRVVFASSFLLAVLCLVFMHIKVDVYHDTKTWQNLFVVRWQPDQTIENLSPIGYHAYDVYTFAAESSAYTLSEKEKSNIKQWFKDKQENLPDNKYAGMFKGKNVITFQVESLENFVIGKKINGQEITPNINKLLGNSLYFSNFYEQVNGGTSSDSDLMINTSVYPVRSGSTFFRYPDNTYNSLPKLFEGEGYSTMSIHPDKGAFWNVSPALKSIGFQKSYEDKDYVHDEMIGLGLSDKSFLRQAEPIVAKAKQPFYAFMVTLTSHSPFDLPKQYRELNLDKSLDDSKLGGYFQSVHYTDKQIGAFIENLKKDNLLDNTVIVLYGDHTGIHKYYQDEVDNMKPAEDWWLDDQKKVPLVIYNPSIKGEEIKTSGGPIDVYPTICYLTGIDSKKYENSAMGRNLLNTNKDFAVLANGDVKGHFDSEDEKKKAIEGLDIADKIIRSNYFKNNK